MVAVWAMVLVGCRAVDLPPAPSGSDDPETGAGETGTAPPDTGQAPIEDVPGWGLGCSADLLFSQDEVHAFVIELDEGAMASLDADPGTYVQGTFIVDDRRFSPVGVHLKGNSSFQTLDRKPAWKIKLDEYVDGWELCGETRLTLNNNVWDTSMMAETLAYRAFRDIGSPAPRTGYATVTLNDELLGLYTLVEAMDKRFVEHRWPGSRGGLWEMNRNCDFTGACDCFDLKWAGEDFDDTALSRTCDGVAQHTADGLWSVFDRDAVLAFFAAEMVVNHPDSYTYNLNNWHMVHDPLSDRIFLSPWGADSTFVYYYPPSQGYSCEVWSRYDNFTDGILGQVTTFCRGDPTCWDQLAQATLDAADVFEAMDVPGQVAHTRELISDAVHDDPRIEWPAEYFDYKVDCLETWTAQRPARVRAWVASRP